MRATTLRLALALTFTAAALADDAPYTAPAPDVGKRAIEAPVERAIAGAAKSVEPANPKVRPGLVRWHAGADEAFAAARKSGRPVLVFQLLGNLDDEFC